MIWTKVAIAGQWSAAIILAVGSWVLAQASSLDTVDRLVGGSIVVAGAIVIVYFTLRFSERQQGSWTALLAAANDRADRSAHDLNELQKDLDDLQVKYNRERDLRIALEERGLSDRRKTIEEREERL